MFGYKYNYLLTEGSIDHIQQDTITLKIPAQKGDGLFFNANGTSKYEVVEVLHFVGAKTILRLNEIKC